MTNHRLLRLSWAQEHRAWPDDWYQVLFSDESRFNLWDPDGCIRVSEMPVNSTFQSISGAIFQQDNVRPYVAKTVRNFFSAKHTQFLLWPAYSQDISSIEHEWDLVGRRLTRDPRPAASKDELLLRIQAIWNFLPQVDIQNLFDSTPRRIAALIAARGGYTKY
ncbi:transposable element Tc1 transposase [Trichonephila clavipes]|uniref:Transposable element Tc1 transposase n=1 Tax=Trichonephila clavipes TaxID=2585209 RepID=A0A8X6V0I4_TRICX|nr:transposable element Tc1 transposase [Trichonephila clavipes]